LVQNKITWLNSESKGVAECSTHSGKAMQNYMAKGMETGRGEELKLFFAILTCQVTDKEKVGLVHGWTSLIRWCEPTNGWLLHYCLSQRRPQRLVVREKSS